MTKISEPTSTSSPLISGNLPSSYDGMAILMSDSSSNMVFELGYGSLGNAGTLYSIVNYVAPAGGNKGDTASLTGGQ